MIHPRPAMAPPQAELSEPRRSIPFDYSFTYELKGNAGKVTSQTVTISIEAAFTAVAIGYGVIPDFAPVRFGPTMLSDMDTSNALVAARPITFFAASMPRRRISLRPPSKIPPGTLTLINSAIAGQQANQTAIQTALTTAVAMRAGNDAPLSELSATAQSVLVGDPRSVSVGDLIRSLSRELGESDFASAGLIGPQTATALQDGIRLNPEVARYFLQSAANQAMDLDQLSRLFVTVGTPSDRVVFLYALYDEASGREFQNEPVLNIAGLGIADGQRPFRYFAEPITFKPQSTVRLDITEKSHFKGELHVSLHGYKVLGGADTPTGRATRRAARRLHR